MKQGSGNNRVGATPPKNRASAVNIGTVAQMGIHEAYRHGGPSKLMKPKGAMSPQSSRTTHGCGSQGKH